MSTLTICLQVCVVWHLQDLAYLECHRVDPARREEAAVRYQGDIFRIRNDEDQVRSKDNPHLWS